MINGDLARFDMAWQEAVRSEDNRRWRRFWRYCRGLKQQLLPGSKVRGNNRKRRDECIRISETQIMTRDGHILEIDPRCDECREKFGV